MLDQKREEEHFAVLHKFTNCPLYHILYCWCVFFFRICPVIVRDIMLVEFMHVANIG